VGRSAPDADDGGDLVHLDYQPSNVLVTGGRISGVVDWDGAARGDRHLDLVTLRFTLAGTAPHLLGPVDERLSAADRDLLRAYWAHMSLRMVDWSIRHHDSATVDRWLTVAETGQSW
jgi:aminoglycoside phosphotransferase (APT) family kinase protein